jgi:hypothetical protein
MTTITSDPPPFSLEDSLLRVNDLMRCAAAVAYEAGDNLTGNSRDMVFSAVHNLATAKEELERSLAYVETR